jgi:uncharacterized membrane protein YvlD (DUF360 family)
VTVERTAAPALRPVAERPSLGVVVWRVIIVTVAGALTLWLLALVLDDFSIDEWWQSLLAGFVIGVVNAVVWPALAVVVVPISVLTLGLGAIALDAIVVTLVLDALPGVTLEGWWAPLVIVLGLAAVTTVVSSVLAFDDDAWFETSMARRARRRSGIATETVVPGVVFVQVDGLAKAVLDRALRSGDVPTLHRWLRDGTHRLTGWETGWSSQTGVSQCGILHGSVVDMPAFRWVDKSTGAVVVSNHPASAAAIERHHSDGEGLLAHNGSSYGNLFSGDAERAVMTMSVIARRKEGRFGAGYFGYFSRPQRAARTLIGVIGDIGRERVAAWKQVRHDVEPRIARNWSYVLVRAYTTIVSRDVNVLGVLNDMCEGRAAIYIDMLGYDEVSHHSGPERADSLAVLRDIDRQIGRIERAVRFAPRPYRIVVLSDHGQTQGAPFAERAGETLAEVVARLCGSASSGDPDAEAGRTESSAWLRPGHQREAAPTTSAPVVLGSGSLGLVYLPGPPRRLTREEIDGAYPDLIPGLTSHPEIGFVLVRTAAGSSVVLGRAGSRDLASGEVDGDDPLAPFGPRAVEQVSEVDGYATVADLMVNSRYDETLQEVAAFEHQVGSHGGLGGPQTHPFLLHPADLAPPAEPIFGSPALHRVLKSWLADLGQPVTTPWRPVEYVVPPEYVVPARPAPRTPPD